jgi:hypothetical protein
MMRSCKIEPATKDERDIPDSRPASRRRLFPAFTTGACTSSPLLSLAP